MTNVINGQELANIIGGGRFNLEEEIQPPLLQMEYNHRLLKDADRELLQVFKCRLMWNHLFPVDVFPAMTECIYQS